MFTIDMILFILFLVAITAGGTYYLFTKKAFEKGLEVGFGHAIMELVNDGFLESETDSDGDESLVSITEVKRRIRYKLDR